MKSRLLSLAGFAAVLTGLQPGILVAQEDPEVDIEPSYVEPDPAQDSAVATMPLAEAPELEEEKFQVYFSLSTEFVATDNQDYRDYEPTQPEPWIDIYDTDDRANIFYTRVSSGFGYQVLDDVGVQLSLSHSGLWGGDKMGGANAFGGFLFMDRLFVEWNAVKLPGVEITTQIGRQPFEIGGAYRDYFFDDVIDGVIVDIDLKKGGKIRLLPVDLYSSTLRPDDVNLAAGINSVGTIPQSSSARYDGDTNTFRMGAIYENTELVKGLELRAFGFYADIGASGPLGTGSDRTFGGAHGNVADNDYNWMAGTRIGYTIDAGNFKMLAYGEFARSGGLDRKATNLGLFDVLADGNAFGAGLVPSLTVNENFGVRGRVQFFMADGADHAADGGMMFNHGFVSFKGAQIGGLAANRIAGWHPSAYVATDGISHDPHARERKAGTMVIHGGIGLDLIKKLSLDVDFYTYADTSSTNYDFTQAITDSAELPFGYDEFDLRAQERLGKNLGFELDSKLAFNPNDVLGFYVGGAVMFAGDFYKIEVSRRVGTAIGATEPDLFWAVSAGTNLTF